MAFDDPAAFMTDFAADATLDGAAVRGVFDNGFASAMDIAGTAPSLLLPSSSAASAAAGQTLVVGGVSYTVTGVEPDGTGMTLLRLREA